MWLRGAASEGGVSPYSPYFGIAEAPHIWIPGIYIVDAQVVEDCWYTFIPNLFSRADSIKPPVVNDCIAELGNFVYTYSFIQDTRDCLEFPISGSLYNTSNRGV